MNLSPTVSWSWLQPPVTLKRVGGVDDRWMDHDHPSDAFYYCTCLSTCVRRFAAAAGKGGELFLFLYHVRCVTISESLFAVLTQWLTDADKERSRDRWGSSECGKCWQTVKRRTLGVCPCGHSAICFIRIPPWGNLPFSTRNSLKVKGFVLDCLL